MGQTMSLSSPSNITITEDGQDEAPFNPPPGQSAVTIPHCILHAECETTSSVTVQLPSPSQTQLTEDHLTQPILSGLSALASPNTAQIEKAESFS